MAAAAVSLYPIQIIVIPRLQAQVNRLAKERVQLIRGAFRSDQARPVQGVEEIRVHGTAGAGSRRISARGSIEIFRVRYSIYLQQIRHQGDQQFRPASRAVLLLFDRRLSGDRGRLDIGTLLAAVAAHKDLAAPWRELLDYYQGLADARIRYQQVVTQFNPEGMTETPNARPPPPKPRRYRFDQPSHRAVTTGAVRRSTTCR